MIPPRRHHRADVLCPGLEGPQLQGGAATTNGSFSGSPPLSYHGGPVMGSGGVDGSVTVVPVFWDPAGTISSAYQNVVDTYIDNIAADRGGTANVFSDDAQYGVAYDLHAGTPVVDTDSLANGCVPDTGSIYSDGSGYTACVTDAQIQTELTRSLSADGLPPDLTHAYVVLLPKGVESCASSLDGAQSGACTLNHSLSTFCAYHSHLASGAVYADIPFPIYSSSVGLTCSPESVIGNESPNGDLDADVAVNSVSHELNESITDPFGTGWSDRRGNEIADDCSQFFGSPLGGTSGALFNQVINGAHYFTQEQFSNEDFNAKIPACVQRVDMPTASFRSRPGAPTAGHVVKLNARASKGNIVRYSWSFGDGSVGSGRVATHTYAAAHLYLVTLTVTDITGAQKSSVESLSVAAHH